MRVLVIETATEACSIALVEGECILAHEHRVIGRGHAEALVPMIAALPEKGRSQRILVSLGPGSFTGIRIGLATARALGFVWGAQVLGYPTLALVAAQARALSADSGVTVCMNGGHGEWFVQHFSGGEPDGPVRSLTPEAASAAGAHPVIAGNRAQELAALVGGERTVHAILPDAAATHDLPETHLTPALAPLYGRGADAVPMADRARA